MTSETETENPTGVTGYAANREILRNVAERLRTESDIDIDQLIPLIDSASAAYKVCRDRLNVVSKLLDEKLPQVSDSTQ